MSDLAFCPKCDTMMSAHNEGSVKLLCSNCGYMDNIVGSKLMLRQNHTKTVVRNMDPAMIYDKALKKTAIVAAQCPNDACDSRDPAKWGIKNEYGKVIAPDVAITNFFSEDRITTYICCICGQTFSPAPQQQ
jgi:DNA-directed RNA polymerase subunit M/transcription elongation factor TFIIS